MQGTARDVEHDPHAVATDVEERASPNDVAEVPLARRGEMLDRGINTRSILPVR
jgi:hypothetical protein